MFNSYGWLCPILSKQIKQDDNMIKVNKLRETIRLILITDFSNRRIGRDINTTHKTVENYRRKLKEYPLDVDSLLNITDSQLLERFAPKQRKSSKRQPDWGYIHQLMQSKHQILLELWEAYCLADPETAYSYSQFSDLYRKFRKKTKTTMRQQYQAGEYCFVDFAGRTIPYRCNKTLNTLYAQIFVANLGRSRYGFVYAVPSQSLPHWIEAHQAMYQFFGGVTVVIVPDNLKSAVIKNHKELILNPTYEEMARHYNTVIEPARPRKPQDKSHAEQFVLMATRWITAVLRRRTFFSIEEINQAIEPLMEKLNNKSFREFSGSRRAWFEEYELDTLKPLPALPFMFGEWLGKKQVSPDSHVMFNGHAYSVPYQLNARKVELRKASKTLEIYFESQRVATHPLNNEQGTCTTNILHLPPKYREYTNKDKGHYIAWAESICERCVAVVEAQFANTSEESFMARKACSKLRSLADQYGMDSFAKACERALEINSPTVKSIESMLRQKLIDAKETVEQQFQLPLHHQNLRGANYFAQGGL
jgi:transposase